MSQLKRMRSREAQGDLPDPLTLADPPKLADPPPIRATRNWSNLYKYSGDLRGTAHGQS